MRDSSTKAAWLPGAATALAIVSCYGTTLLIGLLSLLGISMAVNERAWSGVISVFALLAVIAIAASYLRHRVIGPTISAAIGLGLILWVMYGSYGSVMELLGFASLAGAAVWDWRARANHRGNGDGVSCSAMQRSSSSTCAQWMNSTANSDTFAVPATFRWPICQTGSRG